MRAFTAFWHAQVRMLVPAGYADRDALVQFVQTRSFGCSVHGADEFVAILSLFVEKRCRPRRIEGEAFEVSIPVVREVILSLREVGREDVKAIRQRDTIVPVFFDSLGQSRGNLICAAAIFVRGRTIRRHEHVSAIHVMAVSHGFHRARLSMITRIVFHVHPGHAAIVVHPRHAVVLMRSGTFL